MKNNTRVAYDNYVARQAELNGVSVAAVGSKFSVEPSVQQTLETKIQESSAFLGLINMVVVDEQEGETIGLGVSGPIASRTNTTTTAREPRSLHNLDSIKYRCEKTDFDYFLSYQQLDAWAKFPDFQLKVTQALAQRIALDRIMIGFNGTNVASQTNSAVNTLLQDVNKGWLQLIRETAPQRNMTESENGTGKVVINSTGTGYKNLDALVEDAVSNLLEPWFSDDTELVVICGRKLISAKYFDITNNADKATEKLANGVLQTRKILGGLPAIRVPYMPDNAMLITRLDNISIYSQAGAMRRSIIDNPARDRIDSFISSNDAYVIEDFGAAALIENITIEG
ncbi:phage major capsid protein, P2 family [Pelistega sp. MC2]|uniref:phage major capsid protein, P2 family n=1 Tax=Pelistega sp. MC2 TaxID=1720297 RepID=UPI0008D977D0|nr:phage major capsid protein, P2 family [Pelistega sp. MC2]